MVVGAAVVAVLLHGALTDEQAAEASNTSFLTLPAPPSLPDLRPRLEKTPLSYVSDYYLQLGEQARNKFVVIGEEEQPGVVVTPGVILTSIRVADESIRPQPQPRTENDESEQVSNNSAEPPPDQEEDQNLLVADVFAVDSAEASRPLPLAALDTELGIALFAMEQPYIAPAFAVADPTVMPPGSAVLAVTLGPGGDLEITPGYLVSAGATAFPEDESLNVSVVFAKPPAAAAIVDLDGRLLGAAIESGDGVRFLSSNRIVQVVDRLQAGTPCRAIEVNAVSDSARAILRLDAGLVVERVVDTAFVPESSIRPGDILLRWDGETLSESEQFYSLYDQNPGKLVRYQVLRNQRRVSGATVVPGPDCRPVQQPPQTFRALGLTLRWDENPGSEEPLTTAGGWKVLRMEAESLASSSGVRPGDLITALNGKLLDDTTGEQQLRSAAAAAEPFILTLHQGGRVRLVTVEPEPE